VENAVDKVAEFHKINKETLYQYIEKETNEQLGV
jgi:predicted transcriptional regulator YheO